MSRKRKIGIALLILFLCLMWWRVIFYDQKTGYEEMAIEDGQTSFTAAFDTVHYIVAANNDIALGESTGMATIQIDILDDKGKVVAENISDGLDIHTNGYTSTESCNFNNMPIRLQKGSVYTIQYHAQQTNGTKLTNLSFLLYGTEKNTNKVSLVIFLIIAIVMMTGLLNDKWKIGTFAVLSLLLLLLTITMMPQLQSQDENAAFAKAYGASNVLLHKQECNADGYVYIDESGIRNMGYLSYSVPLRRFWTDSGYGNERTSGQVSSLYRIDQSSVRITDVPQILAVTAARLLRLPYQMVMLAGWFANGIISILLVLTALKILKNHPAEQYYIMLLAMMPAVLISAASYTGMGILIALCALYWALCHNLYENGLQKGKAASAIILLIAIISVQYAYGVLVLLFIRVLQQNQGRKVQLWARITAGIAAAEMLTGCIISQYQLRGSAGSFWQSTPVEYVGALANTVLTRTDALINEIAAYHYYTHDEMLIVVYLTLAAIIAAKLHTESIYPQNEACRADRGAITAWILGLLLLLSCGTYVTDVSQQYGIFRNLTGEQLIPFLFLPLILPKDRPKGSEPDRKLKNIVIICTCMIMMIRMGKL